MSVLDIKFLDSTSSVVYDYLTANSDTGAVTLKIQNVSEDDLENLGIYLKPTSSLGDVDNPADYTPQSALQTLIDWGQKTDSGVTAQGGLKVTFNDPEDATERTLYFSRSNGSSLKTKIKIGYPDSTDGTYNVLPSGGTISLDLEMETPPSVSAKRLFVNIEVG